MIETIISMAISVITPAIMQWLKSEPWMPLIARGRPAINAIVAALVAVGNVVGVSYAFSDGTLTVTGLDIMQMAQMGVTFVLAWITQEVVYRTKVKP